MTRTTTGSAARIATSIFLIAASACGDSAGTGGTGGDSSSGGGEVGGGGGSPSGVSIAGLSAPVDAIYDEFGILHLGCATDADCYAALGYFHAANRFFFMDFVRNTIRGRLGALVKAGDIVVDRDIANRQFFATRDGDPLPEKVYADASPQVKEIIDSYTRGVNGWVADMREGRNGATLSTEYDFALIAKETIRDWEVEDSAAVGLYIMNDFSNKSAAELKRAEIGSYFAPALAADLFSQQPVFEAFAVPPAETNKMAELALDAPPVLGRGLLHGAQRTMALVGSGRESRHPGESGSNNWVLGPSRTANGAALVANDPHIALTNPSVWFPVEIDAVSNGSGVHHIAGSTFPGLPSVILGHNESVAWGLTASNWDLADVYLEELSSDGSTVRFEGEDVPVVERQIEFQDASTNSTVSRSLRWVPHHGPIVAEDLTNGTAMTVRWTGHEGGTDLDAFFVIGAATTALEAREAIALVTNACQNFVVADRNGDIGLYPFSNVPGRPWASATLPPWLPLPGDGSAEWQGHVSIDDLPQVTNPPGGAIVTANQDLTGASADGDVFNDGQPSFQAITRAEGTRARRIMDLIEEGANSHDVDSMTAILGDTYSLYGEVVAPVVLAAVAGETLPPAEQQLVDALSDWSFTCPTGLDGHDPAGPDSTDPIAAREARGCTAFHALLTALTHEALADEIAEANAASVSGVTLVDRSDIHLLVRALRDPTSLSSAELLWDDVSTTSVIETRQDIIMAALSLAAEQLAAVGDPDDWRWGRLHTFSLRSIYDSFGVAQYNDGPYAAPGGLYTVNVANPAATAWESGTPFEFGFVSGASVRFVVEVGPDGPRMSYQLPGGTDLHRDSPFYNQLLSRWLENEPVPFAFGPGAVPSPAQHIVVGPATSN